MCVYEHQGQMNEREWVRGECRGTNERGGDEQARDGRGGYNEHEMSTGGTMSTGYKRVCEHGMGSSGGYMPFIPCPPPPLQFFNFFYYLNIFSYFYVHTP